MSNERMGELEQPPNELESMSTTNTERRLAVTPGEAIIRHDYNVFAGDRLVCNAGGHQNNHDNGKGDAENRANARLYTDAHNTYNACDMLPSELLTQVTKLRAERNELVGALEDLHKYVKRAPFRTLTEADRVLAKHKPE